ncbi:YceI family protein [Streptomyces sp. AC536]|uniref:YceI family protein n=1 Tax=Streptomyces buecherae TaxID=2763006 RepID=UPI00164E268F|nr:YceI family protein [Streptomyces buecherae]MBC3983498.1 YceI family protein [Streptomyces buecherae]QNJ40914.1 YceI family protein [Streptomyces buecherae]
MSTTRPSELTGDYVIDATRTRIGFVARHTMSTRVRGHVDAFEGTVRLDGEHPWKSTVRLVIQAKDVQTKNRQRDTLVRDKFLDAKNHPTITFTSTDVLQSDATHYELTGDLTIRGTTRSVTLIVELTDTEPDSQGNLWAHLKGTTTINRKDWNVNWNAFTSAMVSPTVVVEFDAVVVRG